jgi:outer membrane protease
MPSTSKLIITTLMATLALTGTATAAAWPRIAGQGTDWVNSLTEPQWPAIAGEPASRTIDGPQWPTVGGEVERRFPSPWAFEIGARYWYSTGTTKFGFTNNIYPYGSPTSTLDWNSTTGHSGEVFARLDHHTTGLFVKGVAGAGVLRGGEFIDRDYVVNQYTFSDTTSDVNGDHLRYFTADIGYAVELPRYGVRIGGFVGYHYWREKMTANGLVCNADDLGFCNPPGQLLVPYDTAVLVYEPTWHALRLGVDARYRINRQWSVSGEVALIPFARFENKDSHLLRQGMADLGTAPNIITKGYGYGGMAELFVNYEMTPNLEAALGVRYWGMSAFRGDVTFGPAFNREYELMNFDMNRFGLLAQVKGKF